MANDDISYSGVGNSTLTFTMLPDLAEFVNGFPGDMVIEIKDGLSMTDKPFEIEYINPERNSMLVGYNSATITTDLRTSALLKLTVTPGSKAQRALHNLNKGVLSLAKIGVQRVFDVHRKYKNNKNNFWPEEIYKNCTFKGVKPLPTFGADAPTAMTYEIQSVSYSTTYVNSKDSSSGNVG